MSMTIDDADLIRSFKSGHHEVFEAIVAEHQAELIRHARRRTNDAGTAEDLVQEAFIRAYRAFDRINDDSRVRPWLHQILANVCVDDAYRRRRDDNKTERFSCDTTMALVEPSIEQQLGLHINDTGLEQALADLPDTHRQALIMRFVDELDYDEIALSTGVSEPNARARVSRARNAMRRAIQGAAAFPIACYVLFRRPGKGALAAAPPPDPLAAMKASESVGAASRMAVALQPAIDTANSVVIHAPTAVPLLTKAAIGVGAVAVAVSAAPENPIERPVPIVVEVEASQQTIDALEAPIQLEAAGRATAAYRRVQQNLQQWTETLSKGRPQLVQQGQFRWGPDGKVLRAERDAEVGDTTVPATIYVEQPHAGLVASTNEKTTLPARVADSAACPVICVQCSDDETSDSEDDDSGAGSDSEHSGGTPDYTGGGTPDDVEVAHCSRYRHVVLAPWAAPPTCQVCSGHQVPPANSHNQATPTVRSPGAP